MSTFEFNKIAGAVLFTLLVVVGASVLSKMIYEPEEHGREAGFPEGEQGPEGGPVSTAGVEEAPGEAAEAEPPEAKPSLAASLAQADLEAGEKVAKKCAACHTFEKGGAKKIGPNLWGVLGSPVAGREGFNYSKALKDLGGAWDYARLAEYIADPKGYAPGTKMIFKGVKDEEERINVIAYLRSLSDSPPPLPEDVSGTE